MIFKFLGANFTPCTTQILEKEILIILYKDG